MNCALSPVGGACTINSARPAGGTRMVVSVRGAAKRIATERNQLQFLRRAIHPHLQRHEILKGGIGDSPELLFARFHLDDGSRSAWRCCNLVVQSKLVRSWNPWHQILLANYENALGESSDLGANFFHAFNNQRSGSPAIHLELGESVHVGVVPVEAGRLRGWNLDAKLKARRARLNQCGKHIILMADRRNVQTMEVNVGRLQTRTAAIAAGWARRRS